MTIDNKNFYINLIKTKFNMKGNLKELQSKLIKVWQNRNIYKNLSSINKYFILHDGPPYANGNIHLGHILNKILKDIILKYKNMLGFITPFILGWDCFGLSIEKKLSNNLFKNSINILKLQDLINRYTKFIVNKQKSSFMQFGILNDENNIYKTNNYKNISEEIRVFSNFLKKGLLVKEFKSIYWCYKCESFLSESEIIYYKIFDISIKVIFLFLQIKNLIKIFNIKYKYILGGILIWTTLPWTILENQGLAVDLELIYCLINTSKGLLLINFKFYNFFNFNNIKLFLIGISIGLNLQNINFINPLFKLDKYFYKITKLHKNNNMSGIGTGILHIAPNRGEEDYSIYKKNNKNFINIRNLWLLNGNLLKNFKLFKNNKIYCINNNLLNYLIKNNRIISFIKYNHDYMFCLKHKVKIIYKTINQWFINFKLKFKLNYIKNLKFIPFNEKKNFLITIKNKPSWNISRRRLWGLPLTLFDYKKFKNLIIYTDYIKYISNYYEFYGIRYWQNLLKRDILKFNFIFKKKLIDILDVWFDSGTTHWHVLRGTHKNILNFPSDLYLEGEDQHRGWFQSSIITSILLDKTLPVKSIITHGFVKNIYGEKLSKSLGNFINYKLLIKHIDIDILRLLICNIKYTKTIILSQQIINQAIEIYRKIRNCIRFILSNLSDFRKISLKMFLKFNKISKYFISYTYIYNIKLIKLYNNYNFNKLIAIIKKFLSEDISSLYFNLIKNDLYIKLLNCKNRKLIQIILYFLLKILLLILSPILSFTADEAWKIMYYKQNIFTNKYFLIKNYKNSWYLAWLIIKFIKTKFYNNLKNFKAKKLINSSLIIKIHIFSNKKFYIINNNLINNLNYLLLIKNHKLNLIKNFKNLFIFIKFSKNLNKCKRCWINKNIKNINFNLICKLCFITLYKQNLNLL